LYFSALVVFASYAVIAKFQGKGSLSTSQAFSSLAILVIFRGPAAQLLYTLPMLISMVGTFERIEKFLQKDQHVEHRPMLGVSNSTPTEVAGAFHLKDVVLDIKGSTPTTPINLKAAKGSITMISGPVGCGKSTLLKSILGEVQPKSGRVSISTPYIGYCSQAPWLQNKTLKQNIVGPNEFELGWYNRIIDVCNLKPDLMRMADGDNSLLGSRGITVSGGQKHRIVRVDEFLS
jgi:ATP-binding cassette, subfamily C (CFTR/MRP), member 1